MRPVIARLSVAALIFGLLFPVSVGAADPGNWTTCQGKSYITLAEDSGGGGDRVILCRPTSNPIGAIVNLKNVSHVQSGYCNNTSQIHANDSWNDCVSSIAGRFSTPDGTSLTYEFCVKVYDNDNAGGEELIRLAYDAGTGWWNFSTGIGGKNDRASSIRWGRMVSGVCQFT